MFLVVRFFHLFLVITAIFVLLSPELMAERLFDRNRRPVHYAGNFSAAPIALPPWKPAVREFRGVWVATVGNIDFAKHTSRTAFCNDYIQLVEGLRRMKFNAVILHNDFS